MELQHGFTTYGEWETFFKTYFTQIRELEEINSFQVDKDPEQWLTDFKQKSKILEKKYQENNKYLKRHVHYFTRENHGWERSVADPLMSFLYRFGTRFEDIEAAYELTQSLRLFYEDQKDEIALMKCDMVILNVFVFLDLVHLKGEILLTSSRAIEIFEKHYDELNEEEKSMGLSFYDIQSVVSSEYSDDPPFLPADQIFREYENRMRMLRRFQKEADMDLPLNQILPYFENCWTSSFLRAFINTQSRKKSHFTDSQFTYPISLAERLKEKANQEKSSVSEIKYGTICLMLRYFNGEENAEAIYHKLMDYERGLSHSRVTIWKEYDDETIDSFNLILKSLCILVEDFPACADGIKSVFEHLLDIYTHFPSNNYLEYVANGFIYLYLIPAIKYLEEDKILPSLLKLTAYRQPQTLFHSVMVAQCAKLVIKEIIRQHPEYLTDALFCRNAEEVTKRKNELIDFVEKSSLLHDVGKILCTNVINMQYRKLNDIEFQVIKYHPETSLHILNSIPPLAQYADVAAGHHKFCDGTLGYPEKFDNCSSPNKILIDLVRICDSLDAATDYLGRSYAKNKTFQQVLEELQKRCGSCYSSKIIDIISASDSLQKELNKLLLHDREMICLEMYKEMKGSDIEDHKTL